MISICCYTHCQSFLFCVYVRKIMEKSTGRRANDVNVTLKHARSLGGEIQQIKGLYELCHRFHLCGRSLVICLSLEWDNEIRTID